MLQAQAGSGPPRQTVVSRGEIAFGEHVSSQLPLHTTGNDPPAGSDRGDVLAADLRLDNRDDLCAELGIRGQIAELSDRDVLLKSWERWGLSALDRLVGAFAFAVWEPRFRRAIVARDPQGQRPLHYHIGQGFAAFASAPRGLHALHGVPRRLDMESLARFVDGASPRSCQTYFEGVQRVPPGHFVVIEQERVRTERYWKPNLEPLRFKASDDYVDSVREQLDRAVDACLRKAGPRVGSHLSAGLDSGGVAASAALRLAKTGGEVIGFTAVPSERAASAFAKLGLVDEGPLAAETAALHPNLRQILVRSTGSLLDHMSGSLRWFEQPLPNPTNFGWGRAILDQARLQGLSVMLNGQLGNLGFSHDGLELLTQLFRSGRWLRLAREGRSMRQAGMNARAIVGLTIGSMLPGPLLRALSTAARQSHQNVEVSLARAGTSAGSREARREHLKQWRYDPATARQHGLEEMDFGAFNHGIQAEWGIDMRDPTSDRRVIELCLRIPPEQFLSGGVRRAIARRVLAGRLPPAVLNERRRGYQSADWPEMLDAARPEIFEEARLIEQSSAASSVIDTDRLRGFLRDWPEHWDGSARQEFLYNRALLRALSAGRFARMVEAG